MKPTLSLTVLAVFLLPFDAASAPPPPASTTAPSSDALEELVVDVDPSIPNAATVRRRVEASARSALAGASSPRMSGDRVFVHVTGEQYEYKARFIAVRSSSTIEDFTVPCECNTTELSELMSTEIPRVAARFSETKGLPEVPTQGEPMPVDPTAETEPPAPTMPAVQPHKPALGLPKDIPATKLEPVARTPAPVVAVDESRRLRVAGVVSLVAGGALLFAGAGMMAAGSTELLDRWRHYERDWRPLGYAVGGVGLAGIGVGGSLMIFEEIRCRRRPDSCASNRRYAKRIDSSLAKGADAWARTK